MKKFIKCLSIATLLFAIGVTATACNKPTTGSEESQTSEQAFIDYAGQLKLDPNAGRVQCSATIKQLVDGDTTHFYVDQAKTGIKDGVLKARYLGIDTPESTGKIEEWGKAASNFTKKCLTEDPNTQIIIESNDGTWNVDSTGERHLVFVWYKTSTMTDYRNLNLEIMQNGLAAAKGMSSICYGDIFQKAFNQAMDFKLNKFSGEKDPLYYYGDYVETTIRGLREDPDSYKGILVRFNGLITKIDSNTAYVVDYDEENEIYYGMTVYYGFDASVANEMIVGRRISFCGTFQFYETGGTYQVSGLTYKAMKDLPTNLRILEEDVEVNPVEITGTQFNLTTPDDKYNGISYMECILSSFVTMKDLTVKKVYTTASGSSAGAMTLTCTSSDGKEVQIRTTVLRKADGELLTSDDVLNKTIDVKGVVGKYVGTQSTDYQIIVFNVKDINIK